MHNPFFGNARRSDHHVHGKICDRQSADDRAENGIRVYSQCEIGFACPMGDGAHGAEVVIPRPSRRFVRRRTNWFVSNHEIGGKKYCAHPHNAQKIHEVQISWRPSLIEVDIHSRARAIIDLEFDSHNSRDRQRRSVCSSTQVRATRVNWSNDKLLSCDLAFVVRSTPIVYPTAQLLTDLVGRWHDYRTPFVAGDNFYQTHIHEL